MEIQNYEPIDELLKQVNAKEVSELLEDVLHIIVCYNENETLCNLSGYYLLIKQLRDFFAQLPPVPSEVTETA